MSRNIEIKARVAGLGAVEERARAIATAGPEEILQDDTFFRCHDGRLKLREFADGHGELIHYRRPDAQGPKLSDSVISPVADPASLREALRRALGVLGRIRKRRLLYLHDRTRIHLDDVDGLGAFVELEVVLRAGETEGAGESEAHRIMALLGIAPGDLVEGAYLDLLLAQAGIEPATCPKRSGERWPSNSRPRSTYVKLSR